MKSNLLQQKTKKEEKSEFFKIDILTAFVSRTVSFIFLSKSGIACCLFRMKLLLHIIHKIHIRPVESRINKFKRIKDQPVKNKAKNDQKNSCHV